MYRFCQHALQSVPFFWYVAVWKVVHIVVLSSLCCGFVSITGNTSLSHETIVENLRTGVVTIANVSVWSFANFTYTQVRFELAQTA